VAEVARGLKGLGEIKKCVMCSVQVFMQLNDFKKKVSVLTQSDSQLAKAWRFFISASKGLQGHLLSFQTIGSAYIHIYAVLFINRQILDRYLRR